MKWSFKYIIPDPLSEESFTNSQLWNNEIDFFENKNYLLSSNSGKGKTTFVSYCCGFRNDFKGKLLLNNQPIEQINANNWASIRTRKLAYIPQNLQLLKEHSVWDNLIVKNHLTKFKSEDEILSLLKKFGIEKTKHKKAKEISLGQQQRVSIIRALIQPFETLIMDEPFSHIDMENIEIAVQIIEKICQEQNANFIITSLTEKSPFKDLTKIKL